MAQRCARCNQTCNCTRNTRAVGSYVAGPGVSNGVVYSNSSTVNTNCGPTVGRTNLAVTNDYDAAAAAYTVSNKSTYTTQIGRSTNINVSTSRIIYVDAETGLEVGEVGNRARPYRCINTAYAAAAARATCDQPMMVFLNPGVYYLTSPLELAHNVLIQGTSLEATTVYGAFQSNCLKKNETATLRDFTAVSYYQPTMTMNSDGNVTLKYMRTLNLNVQANCQDATQINGVIYPKQTPPAYPNRRFVYAVTRGTLALEEVRSELDTGDPLGSSETAIFGVNDTAEVLLRYANSVNNIILRNSNNGAQNKYVSTLYANSTVGNRMRILTYNNLNLFNLADATDNNLNVQHWHTLNNVAAPRVEALSTSDRIEINPLVPLVGTNVSTTTTPIQALLKNDDAVTSYQPNSFFFHNFTHTTMRYLSADDTNKFSIRTNTVAGRSVLHQFAVSNIERIPPVDNVYAPSFVNGAQGAADNLRNGANVWTIIPLTNTTPNPWVVRPRDSTFEIKPSAPATTIILPGIRTEILRRIIVNSQNANPTTVQAQAGETVSLAGAFANTQVIPPFVMGILWGPGRNDTDWRLELVP